MQEEIINPELKYESVSFYTLAGIRLLKAENQDTENLGMYALEAVFGGVKLTLGKISTYTRGPRKGQKKYGLRKACLQILITPDKMEAEKTLFEAETGRCSDCFGNGLKCTGWSAKVGNYYKTCKTCSGRGSIV